MRLPTTVRTWLDEFLQMVMERHLAVQQAMHEAQKTAPKDKH
jgi:hypothetical protein